jgi:hypothetical protein
MLGIDGDYTTPLVTADASASGGAFDGGQSAGRGGAMSAGGVTVGCTQARERLRQARAIGAHAFGERAFGSIEGFDDGTGRHAGARAPVGIHARLTKLRIIATHSRLLVAWWNACFPP